MSSNLYNQLGISSSLWSNIFDQNYWSLQSSVGAANVGMRGGNEFQRTYLKGPTDTELELEAVKQAWEAVIKEYEAFRVISRLSGVIYP
jgi:hypothetical protein